MRPTPPEFMRMLGLAPDPWQLDVLESHHQRLLLNCCRQAGKSTVVAVLALAQTLWDPRTSILIVAPSLRQSGELFRKIVDFYDLLERKMHKAKNKSELVLNNGSRIVCLPCKEQTIRGFSGVNLLVLDEAARVPEDVYRAVRPTLIASKGRLICLSTPQGKRGFFYKAWTGLEQDWQRIRVPANMIPRISKDDLDEERLALGEIGFKQEYECTFEVVKGLVYPDIQKCIVTSLAQNSSIKRKVGGIDLGYRNPFAAIWGHTDLDGTLWITHEHYHREQDLDWHADHLPHDVQFFCDPSDPGQYRVLIKYGLKVQPSKNSRRAGISAVQARIRTGRLRILDGACPNLIHESGLHRWADVNEEEDDKVEEPENEYNHALDALRYLVVKADELTPRKRCRDTDLAPEGKPKPPRTLRDAFQDLNAHTGWTYLR